MAFYSILLPLTTGSFIPLAYVFPTWLNLHAFVHESADPAPVYLGILCLITNINLKGIELMELVW
jgi:hypothetical protein